MKKIASGMLAFVLAVGAVALPMTESGVSFLDFSISASAYFSSSDYTIDSDGTLTINDGVTYVSGKAFYGCTSLTSVTIPDSVTYIEDGAFYGCTSLTSVTISDGVTSIGNSSFSGCTSLASITIPSSVTWIGDCSFSG